MNLFDSSKVEPKDPERPGVPENIVPISDEAEREIAITKSNAHKDKYCSSHHGSVIVDSHTRTLECKECGKVIDAFDYLNEWAEKGHRHMAGLKLLEAKTRIAAGELRQLDKRIDNLRAQLKRMGHPQPEVERREYKNAILNADHERYKAV
jgi:hypothetical protein